MYSKEFKQGRGLRTSPIFPKLRDAGGRFNQVNQIDGKMETFL